MKCLIAFAVWAAVAVPTAVIFGRAARKDEA